jgi:signal transduction histidine kinase
LASGDKIENILLEESLKFSGNITASLSHELNNAFAIINEHSGLLDDILEGAKHGVPIDEKKLHRISNKVSAQVERGKELIKRLNRFAHSTDNPAADIDINEMLRAIVTLTQRLAGLKGLTIGFDPPDSEIHFTGNPFYFQQAIFICFEMFMASSEASRSIQVAARKIDKDLNIEIAGPGIGDNDYIRGRKNILGLLSEALDGKFEIETVEDNRQKISLILRDDESRRKIA